MVQLVCILVVQVGLVTEAHASLLTLTFDEVATPVPGGVESMGVTFSLEVGMAPSGDLTYGHAGLGDLTYVMGKVLEGDANGVLTVDFSQPTTIVEFGLALNTVTTPDFHAADVELFDGALMSLGVTPLLTSSLIFFSEGIFSYSGVAVARVVIDFDDAIPALPPRFALDNLTIESGVSAPEPGSLLLLAVALALGSSLRRPQHL
jgi:hypothetical protein